MLVRNYAEIAENLVDYMEHDKTQQAASVMTVPAQSYLDPDRWALEIDRIFKRLPLLLAMTAELPKPGDYKAMQALGLPILIARGKDGEARAFLNVCTHRANLLAPQGHGNCARFSCIYHGWTYTSDGRLVGVSDGNKFGEFDRSTRHLKALPCAERAGMIFVTLTPDAPMDIDGFLGGMLPELAAFDMQDWHYFGSREIVGANWKVAYDGYLEGYHFATAHPKTIHPRTPSNLMTFDAHGPHIRTGYAQTSILAQLGATPKERWGECENAGFGFVRTLFPNVSFFITPEITQIAQLFPGPTPAENRTVLNFYRRTPAADAEDAAGVEQMIDFLRTVVNDEDYLLGLRVQRGLESHAIDSVIFGRNEAGNQLFHRYVDYYVNGDFSVPPPTL